VESIELFQPTPLTTFHELPIPAFLPSTQDHREFLLVSFVSGPSFRLMMTHYNFVRPVKFPPSSTSSFYVKAQEAPYRLLPPLLWGYDYRFFLD
jgi:hypothetical protein